MKKIVLILLAIFALKAGYSQTEKGKMFVGGQINLSGNSKSSLDTLSKQDLNAINFTFAPSFGYFLKDNFAIGAKINFGVSNSTDTYKYVSKNGIGTLLKSSYEQNTLSYGIGAFARYYIKITDNFKFFINGEVNYLYQTQKNSNYTTIINPEVPVIKDIIINNLNIGISPGLEYFATSKLSINTTFGNIFYNYSSSKNNSVKFDNHINSNGYGVNLNFTTFYFGVIYHF